jgi:hypothetical protein
MLGGDLDPMTIMWICHFCRRPRNHPLSIFLTYASAPSEYEMAEYALSQHGATQDAGLNNEHWGK